MNEIEGTRANSCSQAFARWNQEVKTSRMGFKYFSSVEFYWYQNIVCWNISHWHSRGTNFQNSRVQVHSTSIGGGSMFYYTSYFMKRFILHVHRARPLNGFENGSNSAENRIDHLSLTSWPIDPIFLNFKNWKIRGRIIRFKSICCELLRIFPKDLSPYPYVWFVFYFIPITIFLLFSFCCYKFSRHLCHGAYWCTHNQSSCILTL